MPFGTAYGLGNGSCTSATASAGQWYYQPGAGGTTIITTCTNATTISTTCTNATTCGTNTVYSNGQWYIDQYKNALYNQCAQHHQPQKTQKELQAEDQRAYQKALNEHNGQEAARLRRIISDREQAMAVQRAAQAKREQEYKLEQDHKKAADKRALDLLFEHLTPAQRKTHEDHKWFVVEGGKSKAKYRIRTNGGLSGNIDVMEGEQRLHRLCAHLRHDIPFGDQILAQKIVLETDEDAFLRVANRRAA